jgi:hypothetical protein
MENAASAKHTDRESARHKGEFRKVPLRYTNAIPRRSVLYFEKRGRIYVLKEQCMGSASISVDEFQALEQKVLQTVELIKREREARAAAEAEVAAVKTELTARKEELALRGHEIVVLRQELAAAGDANAEVQNLQREREAVRLRVEKMLASIEEIV